VNPQRHSICATKPSFIVSTIYETKDRRKGIGAFLEKRQARFKGE